MGLSSAALTLLGVLLVGYALIERKLSRTAITGPMVFTVVGLVLGPRGIDLVDLRLGESVVETFLTTTLAVVLFIDATKIDVRSLRRNAATPVRLLALGFPVMILFGFLLGWLVFPRLDLIAVLAIAVVLAPTDAALGQAVVANPSVPVGIRQSLSVESGLNDGLALPALFTVLAMEAAVGAANPGSVLLREMGTEIGWGLVAGVLAGGLGTAAIRGALRVGLAPTSAAVGVAAIGVQVATAGAASVLGGSLLIAVFVAGLIVGPSLRLIGESVFVLGESLTAMLTLLAFLLFGSAILSDQLGRLDWRIGVYAVLSLVAVRPLSVAVAQFRSGNRLPTIAFLGWFGPRGLGSVLFVFTIQRLSPSFEGLSVVTAVMAWTVTLSIILHGLTAWPGSNRYARYSQGLAPKETSPAMRPLPDGAFAMPEDAVPPAETAQP